MRRVTVHPDELSGTMRTDEMTPPSQDQRRYPRLSSSLAVLATRLGESPREEIGRTRVVGLGGCSFVSRERFGVGSALELLITVGRDVIRSHVRVVYENPSQEGWEVGVEFLEISQVDRQRLARLFDSSTDN